jgi:hypothetical protein
VGGGCVEGDEGWGVGGVGGGEPRAKGEEGAFDVDLCFEELLVDWISANE